MKYVIFGTIVCAAIFAWLTRDMALFTTPVVVPAESVAVATSDSQRPSVPTQAVGPVKVVLAAPTSTAPAAAVPATTSTNELPKDAEATGTNSNQPVSSGVLEWLITSPQWSDEELETIVSAFDQAQQDDVRAALREFSAF